METPLCLCQLTVSISLSVSFFTRVTPEVFDYCSRYIYIYIIYRYKCRENILELEKRTIVLDIQTVCRLILYVTIYNFIDPKDIRLSGYLYLPFLLSVPFSGFYVIIFPFWYVPTEEKRKLDVELRIVHDEGK